MSEDSDQKFGLEGIEQSQGFEKMPVANPVSSPDDLPADAIFTEEQLAHAKRPATDDWGPEPVERDYVNNQTGEATPSNQVVGERQAAADLAAVRAAEADARKLEGDRDLADALDQLNARDQGQQPPVQQDQQQPVDEIQPEATEAVPADRSGWDPVDVKIGQILESDPAIAERIQSSYAQVGAEARAYAEQVKQQYAAATSQLAQEINIVTAALIPEIVGMSPEQARGAMAVIAKNDPARAQQIANFANRVQGAVNLTQRQADAQQRQQSLIAESQQQQAAEAFKKYAEAEDARALAGETPETISTIRKTILADAKAAGISEKDLYGAYNTIPALRHSFVQGLMADGAKWRAAQRSITQSRANPIPRVQRPGTSVAGPRADDGDLSAAAARFNLPGGSEGQAGLKNAAAWLTARRARGG